MNRQFKQKFDANDWWNCRLESQRIVIDEPWEGWQTEFVLSNTDLILYAFDDCLQLQIYSVWKDEQ